MPSLRRLVWTVPVLIALAPSFAGSAVPVPVAEGTIELKGSRFASRSARLQQELSAAPEWKRMRNQHGPWRALWNERTKSPHRAYGPAFALTGFRNSEGGADAAVRGFIAEYPGLFGDGPNLELTKATQVNDLWYVRYRQKVAGVPILYTDWEFRVSASGKLMLFGADAHRPSPKLVLTPRIPVSVAREAARAGIDFDPARDRIEGGDLYVLPVPSGEEFEYRLVYEIWVRTSPRGNWRTLVDAHTGEILMRRNRVFAAVGGTMTGQVHLNLPSDALTTQPFQNAYVTVGTGTVTTNASGAYSGAASGTVNVNAKIRGPYVDVERCINDICPSNDAFFSTTAPNGSTTTNIAWTISNSQDSERDAFYHVMKARDFVKSVDPAFNATDYEVKANVDLDDSCNAFWDGFQLQFLAAGEGCPATAQMPDFVYHEYGHAVNDNLYFTQGVSVGMDNYGLHEGTADVNATLMQDNPIFGKGIFGVGTHVRSVDNTYKFPNNQNPVSAHETGLIVAGAIWDLREALGLTTARRLAHFAKYGVPDDLDDGTALNEYFIEVLVADDNDANLANGTPNYTAIVNAFNAHGIGTNYFIDFDVTTTDQPNIGPFPVNVTITYNGPVGALDGAATTFHYSVNGGPFNSLPMFPTGNPDEYGAQVPTQAAAIIQYYVQAATQDGGVRFEPWGAPGRTHSFLGGPFSILLENDFETHQGWTVGGAGDSATTGLWERTAPQYTFVQPGTDHSSDGLMCYVTGPLTGMVVGDYDVDGGKTTLTSATFDATQGGFIHPAVSYYRWFTNNGGDNPDEDPWVVQISNNGGGSWVTVENTLQSDRSWYRVLFFIDSYLTPTNNMKIRFVATDQTASPSLVEALVDDFAMMGYPPNVDVVENPGEARSFALAPPAPNPSRGSTLFRFRTSERGRAVLTIFDLQGRAVRSIVDADVDAGEHVANWDGRDQRGRLVANGPYFARLTHGQRRASEAVVIMR